MTDKTPVQIWIDELSDPKFAAAVDEFSRRLRGEGQVIYCLRDVIYRLRDDGSVEFIETADFYEQPKQDPSNKTPKIG